MHQSLFIMHALQIDEIVLMDAGDLELQLLFK